MRDCYRLFVPVLLMAAVAAGCGGDGSGKADTPGAATPTRTSSAAAGQSLISIQVADNSFAPANLTVPKGTKVTWDWAGTNPHSVVGTWAGSAVQSAQQRGSGTFAFTFEAAGTFNYQCGVHGAAMAGKVTVKP